MLKAETTSRNFIILQNIFDISKNKSVHSKKIKEYMGKKDAYFFTVLRNKKILLNTSNAHYKWNTIPPTKDMAIAVAKACYEYHKNRKTINNLNPNTTNSTITKKEYKKVGTNSNFSKAVKSKISILWGLYTKETY